MIRQLGREYTDPCGTLNRTTTMPPSKPVFSTPLTKLFGINHPVMLAGMNVST